MTDGVAVNQGVGNNRGKVAGVVHEGVADGNQQNLYVDMGQHKDRHRSNWPGYMADLDDDMIQLIRLVERLSAEVSLLRYRLDQLETTTRIGITLYALTVIIGMAVVLYLIR